MNIETPNLILRAFNEADWEAVHAYGGDPQVCEFMEWGPNSVGESKDFVRRSIRLAKQHPRCGFEYAIDSKADGKLIGSIGLYLHEPRRQQALMGYTLARDYWGKGFGTDAARAMLNFGFKELKLHRISAMCDVRNIGSFRVMEKAGMRREGLFLKEKFVKGQWRDTLVYSILSYEWSALVGGETTLNQIDI
jgi:RimJ/RimL family protein N-acetyltransferase